MTLFFLPSHTAAAATHEAIYTNAWEKRKVKDFLVIRLLRRRNRYNFSFEKCLALSFWCSSLVGNKSMSIGVEVFRIETESNFKLWKKHEKFLDRIEVDSLPQPKKGEKLSHASKETFFALHPSHFLPLYRRFSINTCCCTPNKNSILVFCGSRRQQEKEKRRTT